MVGRSERKTSAEDNSPADPLRRGLLGGYLAGFEGAFFGGSLGALLGLWLWGRDFADPFSGFFLLTVLVAAGAVLGAGFGWWISRARRGLALSGNEERGADPAEE